MKTVNIIGGLGNQLFQYAFALALQAEFPQEEVRIYTKCFNGYSLHNGYELDELFDIKLQKASFADVAKVAYPMWNYRSWQIVNHFFPLRSKMIRDKDALHNFDWEKLKDKSYFDGYWQSPRFFEKHKDQIIEVLRFKDFTEPQNIEAQSSIEKAPTAFLHVRRGDYLNLPATQGICTLEYYKNGLEVLKTEKGFKQFLIFSNDQQWCKDNLGDMLEGLDIIYVDWNSGIKSFRDIQLMSMCQGALIANSSFSWWGAWLGKKKTVIAPQRWFNDDTNPDMIPDDWIKVPSH